MSSNPASSARVWIAFFCLFVLLAAGLYSATDLGRIQDDISMREDQAALQGIADPHQLDEALRQHPSNRILRLMAAATKAASDTRSAVDQLSSQIEPAALSKDINFGTASRDDLEAFRQNLRMAAANASTFLPRYVALFKAEHDKVENAAHSLHVPKQISSRILNGLTQRHAKILGLISGMLSARADYYRAYEKYVAVLSGEFGSYKVVSGQFIFPLPRTVERYNTAAQGMTSAATRVTEREAELKKQNQPLPEEWLSLER